MRGDKEAPFRLPPASEVKLKRDGDWLQIEIHRLPSSPAAKDVRGENRWRKLTVVYNNQAEWSKLYHCAWIDDIKTDLCDLLLYNGTCNQRATAHWKSSLSNANVGIAQRHDSLPAR